MPILGQYLLVANILDGRPLDPFSIVATALGTLAWACRFVLLRAQESRGEWLSSLDSGSGHR